MSVVATDGIRNALGYINMCAVGHGFKRKFDYIIDCELRDFLSISPPFNPISAECQTNRSSRSKQRRSKETYGSPSV